MCHLVLCERGFSKKTAFTFLEEMSSEFMSQHGQKVPQATRPYSCIEFGELTSLTCLVSVEEIMCVCVCVCVISY